MSDVGHLSSFSIKGSAESSRTHPTVSRRVEELLHLPLSEWIIPLRSQSVAGWSGAPYPPWRPAINDEWRRALMQPDKGIKNNPPQLAGFFSPSFPLQHNSIHAVLLAHLPQWILFLCIQNITYSSSHQRGKNRSSIVQNAALLQFLSASLLFFKAKPAFAVSLTLGVPDRLGCVYAD